MIGVIVLGVFATIFAKGDVVLDAFIGSGSTLLAAHQLNRIGYGVEIDPGYVAVTLERMAALGLKPELANAR